jgi:hypothetical protein
VRRPLFHCGAGLAVAGALFTLSGCNGFQDQSAGAATSRSTPASSSALATVSPGTAAASAASTPFCTGAARLVADTNASSGNTSDPVAAAKFFDDGARRFRSVTPPQDIATQWKAVADGLEQLSQAYAGTNLADVQQELQLEQTLTQVQNRIGPAQNQVNQYLHDTCGLDMGGGTATSSPSVTAPVLVTPTRPSA